MTRTNSKTILIVEDEVLIAIAEKMNLEKHGFTVLMAHTGEDAIETIKASPSIDLILMDIDLGKGMDGTEAAETILKHRDLPVVFLSSHTERTVVEKTEGITSYGYIVKNSGETVLLASINMAFRLFDAKLGEKNQREELRRERERLSSIIKGTNVGTWEWDVSTGEIILNERWAEIIGYTLEEISPVSIETWVHFAHPDDLKKRNELLARHFAGEVEYYETETRMRHKNGNWIWVLDRGKVSSWIGEGKPLMMQGTHQDITARKNSEEQLRKSEEKFSKAFTGSPEAMTIASMEDGRYIDVNDVFCRITGFPRDEVIGRTSSEINVWVEPEDRTRFIDELSRNGQLRNFETRYRMRSGKVRLFMVSSEIIQLEGKRCSLNFITDITERNKAEESLLESEMKYKRLTENSPAVVYQFMMTPDGKYSLTYINEALFDLTGISSADAMLDFSNLLAAIHPDDLTMFNEGVLESAKTLKPYQKEFRFIVNGNIRWIEARSTPELIHDGNIIWDGFLINITERRNAEEALRNERDRAQMYLEMAGVMFITLNRDGIITLINSKGCQILGLSREDVLGKNWFGHFVPEAVSEDVKSIFDTMMHGEEEPVEFYENAIVNAAGEERLIAWHNTLLRDSSGNISGTLSSGVDITDQRRMEEALWRQLREKEVLLRETHHRIKNNIASIAGLLTLQADSATSPEAVSVLQDAISRVNIMRELYTRMLMADEYRDIPAAEYLSDLIDSVTALYAGHAEITIINKMDDFTLGSKLLIPLGIILNELLSNSMKYAFVGRESGMVSVSAVKDENSIRLVVKDDGNGLPDGFSIESSRGFGLMLVKMLCEQINADLTIENRKGTRAVVEFNV